VNQVNDGGGFAGSRGTIKQQIREVSFFHNVFEELFV